MQLLFMFLTSVPCTASLWIAQYSNYCQSFLFRWTMHDHIHLHDRKSIAENSCPGEFPSLSQRSSPNEYLKQFDPYMEMIYPSFSNTIKSTPSKSNMRPISEAILIPGVLIMYLLIFRPTSLWLQVFIQSQSSCFCAPYRFWVDAFCKYDDVVEAFWRNCSRNCQDSWAHVASVSFLSPTSFCLILLHSIVFDFVHCVILPEFCSDSYQIIQCLRP